MAAVRLDPPKDREKAKVKADRMKEIGFAISVTLRIEATTRFVVEMALRAVKVHDLKLCRYLELAVHLIGCAQHATIETDRTILFVAEDLD